MHRRFISIAASAILATMLTACATAPDTRAGKERLERNAQDVLSFAEFKAPGIDAILRDAQGYAVFPKVGKGGLVAGGTYGRGVLYELGELVGYCDVTQVTVGGQIGGQAFTMIICFETKDAIDRLKTGTLAFDAAISAVANISGVTAAAKYANGVMVFVMDESGLMAQATIGAQKFRYQPK